MLCCGSQDQVSSPSANQLTPSPTSGKMSSRKVFVGGNWKCNGTTKSVAKLVDVLAEGKFPENVEVVVAPTALHLGSVMATIRPEIKVAVQNIWEKPTAGAWTGELTCDIVRDFGIEWAILGHSERRAYCNEDPEKVGLKVGIALEAGLNVIPCIGEQLEDREAGKTMEVCKAQLDPIIAAIPPSQWDKVVIAYEPVWAIGTGVTATPEQAQETHAELRKYLASKIGDKADSLRIIYGGSVKADNCETLIANPDIDGFLVGGASLKPEFHTIIQSATVKSKM